jgi:3-deoxy-manno-octulosonate cytidylyltransferase (CMP-KDO synthetase)
MKIIGIIPARMASSRFPGKPLALINGIPMIGHVYFRSKMSEVLDEVYIATCDKEVLDYARSIGAKALLTKDSHERATDRTAEAMLKIERETGSKTDIVVMIQGDEPMIVPEMIDEAVRPLIKDRSILITNLMAPLATREEQEDPNEVKVVTDRQDYAMYFSREPIPSSKKGAKNIEVLKQVCVIPFRRDFLIKFNELEPTKLEIIESVDMLRALEHGFKVKMVATKYVTFSVDTQDDLAHVSKLMLDDKMVDIYAKKGGAINE